MFYPGERTQLRDAISHYMDGASVVDLSGVPKALIVPHAGYIYSGAIAASAYASILARRDRIQRVVLMGPSHRVYLRGIALPQWREFATPLGNIPVDEEHRARLLEAGHVVESNAPHALEHSLEVQLPFLQMLLGDFTLTPLVAGDAAPHHVAAVLASVWGDDETLVLISSDLSHYHTYEIAREIDSATSAAILSHSTQLTGEQACGAVCINGLSQLALDRRMRASEIARMNSGDTAGDRARVVGYGAFAIHEGAQS
jgi:MEMO1 family protein